jgi:hypothetical protein
LFFILPAPTWFQLRDPPDIVEVDCEDFDKLFHTKWTNGRNEALYYTSSVISIWLLDLPQHTFVIREGLVYPTAVGECRANSIIQ